MDILQTLGGATLATTTVVLGASMFPQGKSSQTVDQQVTSGMPLVHHLGWGAGGGCRGGEGVGGREGSLPQVTCWSWVFGSVWG